MKHLPSIAFAALVATSALASPERYAQVVIGRPEATTLSEVHDLLEEFIVESNALAITQPQELDPNDINSTRVELLQTLVGLNAALDQATRASNEVTLRQLDRQENRQDQLFDDIEEVQGRLLEQVALRSALQQERMEVIRSLPPDATPEEDRAAAALLERITALNADIDLLQAELATLRGGLSTTAPGTLSSSTPSAADTRSNLDTAILESEPITSALSQAASGESSIKIPVSQQIDSYIGAGYELLAKKATRLRTRLGEHQQLVFLRLPQSIVNVSDSRRARKYRVRVNWTFEAPTDKAKYAQLESEWVETCGDYEEQMRDDYCIKPNDPESEEAFTARVSASFAERTKRAVPHVLELIPAKNALNVLDSAGEIRGFSLLARFGALLGLGAGAAIDRRRELFRQNLQQDVFASGYGNGTNRFGWTFSPIPGSRRLTEGPKTTFAVLVVPEYTQHLALEANWCVFRANRQEQLPVTADLPGRRDRHVFCSSPPRKWEVPVRFAGEQFWITNIVYSSVQSGRYIGVQLEGERIPPNIGVAVAGRHLARIPSIDAFTVEPGDGFHGAFIRSSRKFMRLIFRMPRDYVGTPTITLIEPDKIADVNNWNMKINYGKKRTSLAEYAKSNPMFRKPLALNADSPIEFRSENSSGNTTVVIRGEGFAGDLEAYINGRKLSCPWKDDRSSQRAVCTIGTDDFPKTAQVEVVVLQAKTEGIEQVSKTVPNTILGTIGAAEVVHFDPTAGTAVLRVAEQGDVSFDVVAGAAYSISGRDPFPDHTRIRVTGITAGDRRLDLVARSGTLKTDIGVVTVDLPRQPTISQIRNSAQQDKPQGPAAGGYLVEIHGANLGAVASVTFGSTPAEVRHVSATVLQVEVPKGTAGQTVPVVVELRTRVNGRPLSSVTDLATGGRARFTYLKSPESSKKESG